MSDLMVWQQANGGKAWSMGKDSASLLMAPPMMAIGPKAPGAPHFSSTAGHTSIALLNYTSMMQTQACAMQQTIQLHMVAACDIGIYHTT